ncbi:MAG: type IV pilus secretin PilQ [Myxococcota bacterium]
MRARQEKILRTSVKLGLTACALVLLTVSVAIGEKPRLNRLSHLAVNLRGGETVAEIATTSQPTYTVFKLKSPEQLIIDVAEGDVSSLDSPQEFDRGHIVNFTTASFDNAERKIGRIIFGLAPGATYNVKAEENKLVINISGDLTAERKTFENSDVIVAPENKGENINSQANERGSETTVVRLIENPLVTIQGIEVSGEKNAPKVTIKTQPPAETFELLELENPRRIVVDIPNGIKPKSLKSNLIKHPAIKGIRFGEYESKLRIVFDIAEGYEFTTKIEPWEKNLKFALLEGEKVPTELAETMKSPKPAAETGSVVPENSEKAAPAKVVAKPESGNEERKTEEKKTAKTKNELVSLSFDASGKVATITAEFAKLPEYRIMKKGDRVKILEATDVSVPEKLRKSLDTTAYASPVTMVSSFSPQESKDARIVLNLKEEVKQTLTPVGNKLIWKIYGESYEERSVLAYSNKQLSAFAAKTAAEEAGATDEGDEGAAERRKYRGKRISLDFKDADIGNILRLIADVSRLNIVASDDVKGKITVTLRNVPWDEALDIVLRSKGLDKERRGNIIRVAPIEILQKEAEMRRAKKKAMEKTQPLKVRLIPVNYAVASELADKVKDLLSDRGSVTVDERTNVLVVKDIHENLFKAENLVRNLDTQTPQVLIEARIVEANTQSVYTFGIQWGGKAAMSPGTNNATGLIFPNTVGIFGGADDGSTNVDTSGTSNPGNFAVNLPAPVGAGSGGAVGFIFGSAGGSSILNLRISALEQEGEIKVVSSPRITTLDNKTASIEQGVSIPISVVSAAGVQTVFVNATLKLEVTPHVTADGSVLMMLKISNNQPDFGRTGARGDPTILKEEAETEMLVRDSDTAVIGGIYVRRTGAEQAGVPLLSRIPVLGWLFKRTTDRDERAELLIFITPRIINRSQSFVTST